MFVLYRMKLSKFVQREIDRSTIVEAWWSVLVCSYHRMMAMSICWKPWRGVAGGWYMAALKLAARQRQLRNELLLRSGFSVNSVFHFFVMEDHAHAHAWWRCLVWPVMLKDASKANNANNCYVATGKMKRRSARNHELNSIPTQTSHTTAKTYCMPSPRTYGR